MMKGDQVKGECRSVRPKSPLTTTLLLVHRRNYKTIMSFIHHLTPFSETFARDTQQVC